MSSVKQLVSLHKYGGSRRFMKNRRTGKPWTELASLGQKNWQALDRGAGKPWTEELANFGQKNWQALDTYMYYL
jgi:hypothetical protein